MRDLPQRARRILDLASILRVCPQCLGDLVERSDFAGDYYCCLQCNVRTEPRSRIGRLADLPTGPQPQPALALADDAFDDAATIAREVLMG